MNKSFCNKLVLTHLLRNIDKKLTRLLAEEYKLIILFISKYNMAIFLYTYRMIKTYV